MKRYRHFIIGQNQEHKNAAMIKMLIANATEIKFAVRTTPNPKTRDFSEFIRRIDRKFACGAETEIVPTG